MTPIVARRWLKYIRTKLFCKECGTQDGSTRSYAYSSADFEQIQKGDAPRSYSGRQVNGPSFDVDYVLRFIQATQDGAEAAEELAAGAAEGIGGATLL